MDRNDRQAIEQLFGKLAAVERQSPPRDAEAEAYIGERVAAQPGAPYYMAQTIVVQEQALEAAQARIEELEAQVGRTSRQQGGLFGSLFGDDRPSGRSGSVPRVGRPAGAANAQPVPPAEQARRGGGFLAGAAQTALGVTGGILLGNVIAGMLGGTGEAQAAEADAGAQAEEPQVEDTGLDGGFDDFEF